ncbi:MAG: response regulator [Labilibaculum sp.]|nr:response regulator [Labilibaculum sp.]MBI9059784.1 response regulator [Labilibaculum sp.]
MKQHNNIKNKFSQKAITQPFIVAILVVILIFFITFTYINIRSTKEITGNQIQQIEKLIIQSKKDYIQTAVNRTIQHIKLEETSLLEELKRNNPKITSKDTLFLKQLKRRCATHIRNITLKDSGYIWVNEILNYNGGDNYAIRKVHPNLPETEGLYLSTNLKDTKGNTPYLAELEGIKQNGQLFFKYWFKKPQSNQISQKLTYAKLYKKFDWIIATGVYLDDVESIITTEIEKGKNVANRQIVLSIFMIVLSLILALITLLIFNARIKRTVQYYISQVNQNEKSLNEFNENLEKLVEERTSQLNESEQRYKALFKKNQSVMMLIDPSNGKIVDANQAAIDFYGYSFEIITSMKINQINTNSNADIKNAIIKTTTNNKSYFTFKHQLASGELRDVEVYSEMLFVNRKELLFSIIHDISDIKRTQQELLEAKKKAEESDKLKTAFLANMSHEIRTPMNAILGFSGLLASPANSPEKTKRFIEIISNAGEQLMTIINDIVDISKIESNQLNISLSKISVNKTLINIFDVLKKNAIEREKYNIELKLHLPKNDQDYIIETDEIRFIQICNNLLNNSLKFTDKGIIEFGYRKLSNDAKSHLEFYVRDTGCGIPEEKFDVIFDRFSQVTDEIFREGNGLGLSITKGLISLLDGKIKLESTVNVGTTFYFTIPLKDTSTPEPTPNIMFDEKEEYDFSGTKIIIAEDDLTSFSFLNEVLLHTNATIQHVYNGAELLKSLENNSPDIILLDINMPVMNGYQAIKEIRKTDKDLIVIAQTAYAMQEEKERILNAGCDDYISKPIKKKDLYKILSKHIYQE